MKKKIHFVGVKGVGMTPLAIIAKEAGMDVSGCDIGEEFITDKALIKAGISPLTGFSSKHIINADIVVTTSAHGGLDNPEVSSAKEEGTDTFTQGEALGLFQSGNILGKDFDGISVAGSHGKTTTSAMLATVLFKNQKDPSFAIGTGEVSSLPSCGHFGKGRYFIAEADEYINEPNHDKTPKFLFQKPKMIIVTNIDFDHPDVFSDIDDVKKSFLEFAKKLPSDGVLIVCGDGDINRSFIDQYGRKKITYGFSEENDYVIHRMSFSEEKSFFWLKRDGIYLGEFSLGVFGEQNILNATAVVAASIEIGLSVDEIKKGLSSFTGSKRRAEFLGLTSWGALVYDDYAHHPREIKSTLMSFRKAFPRKRLLCIFQPHMYSRTKVLFDDFTRAFDNCDELIITEIFPSFREVKDPNFSAKLLSDRVNERSNKSLFISEPLNVIKYFGQKNKTPHTIIITMGAGDIYKLGKRILGI